MTKASWFTFGERARVPLGPYSLARGRALSPPCLPPLTPSSWRAGAWLHAWGLTPELAVSVLSVSGHLAIAMRLLAPCERGNPRAAVRSDVSFHSSLTADAFFAAVGCGRHVQIAAVESSRTLEVLSVETTVGAVAFHPMCPHLAVGHGECVTVYEVRTAEGGATVAAPHWARCAELSDGGGGAVSALAWAAPSAGGAALWVGGQALALWVAPSAAASSWSCSWRQELPRPVRLMAASTGGLLLAAAAEDDRVVRVWQPAAAAAAASYAGRATGLAFECTELLHPCALASLGWRPPGRNGPEGVERGAAPGGGGSAAGSAVLLTCGADGVPRLWRAPAPTEPASCRMFLCATLVLDASGGGPGPPRPVQLVQWLTPTARRGFPASCVAAEGLAGLESAPLSPLFSPSPRRVGGHSDWVARQG